MLVMENIPSKTGKVLYVVMQGSACITSVLLVAAFITAGDVFNNTLMVGFFSWSSVVLLLTLPTFVILQHIKPSSTKNN